MINGKSQIQRAFTLIEVLITVSIIGLLASLTLISFGGVQKTARDTQRKSDLKQYGGALENFANMNQGLYPSRGNAYLATTVCEVDMVLTSCPDDPKKSNDPSYYYRYSSNGTGGGNKDATKFVIWSKIEKTTDYWVFCSEGKVGTKTQTGFSVSGGNCPI